MSRIVLAEAYRTPIGVFGGAFKDIPAYDLGATLIKHILKFYKQVKDKTQLA